MTTVWDGEAWSSLPRLEADLQADVCVVGLGGSGLSAIDELITAGASVVGLDAGSTGSGAAGRNGGFLLAGLAQPYHRVVALLGAERAAALYRLTLEELDRVEAATPAAVRRTGSLRIEDTDAGLADCSAQAAALRAAGFPVQDYAGPEGRGLLFPSDAVVHPLARCRAFAHVLQSRGAELFEFSPATSLEDGRVRTEAGSVRCRAVLVCVDGGIERLLPELGGRVRTVRLQMLGTAPTAQVCFPRPVYLRDGYEYWQQLPDGRLAVGGFRDLGGADEETLDTTPTPVVQSALDRLLRERIGARVTVTHRWAASVGYTASGFPFVGQVRSGVFAAAGYCGTGNLVGALCGRALAAAALGKPSQHS